MGHRGRMPSRRRHRQSSVTSSSGPTLDPVSQFGKLLRESAEREADVARRAEQQRNDAVARRRAADERAAALRDARRALDRAIEAVRRARSERRGEADADAAWRAAKARVIELETGVPPEWAPAARAEGDDDDDADPTSTVE